MKRAVLGSLVAAFVVASLVVVDAAEAAVLRYRASGNWNLITDGASPGWGPNPVGVGTSLPGASDDARVNFGNNTVTVNTTVPDVSRVQIGVDESGILEVNNGGVLTTVTSSGNGDILAGNNNSNATGTLNVNNGGTVNVGRILWAANDNSDGNININSGGQVNVASHLWWGVSGTATINISGTLDQSGGILGLGTNNASTPTGGTATVNILDGGALNLFNISGAPGTPSIQPGSVLDINGSGQLTVNGDLFGVMNDYINAGKIIGAGIPLNPNLAVDFNVTNPGRTTVQLIPEPATVMLFALGLGGIVLRKRR